MRDNRDNTKNTKCKKMSPLRGNLRSRTKILNFSRASAPARPFEKQNIFILTKKPLKICNTIHKNTKTQNYELKKGQQQGPHFVDEGFFGLNFQRFFKILFTKILTCNVNPFLKFLL